MNKKYFFFQKKTFRNSVLFIGMMVFSLSLFSQGATCPAAEVLCTPNAAFPAETSAPDLGPLPSCGTQGAPPGYPETPTLSTTPNPAFYTLQVVQSGDLYLFINTFPQKDVDFAIWGPYSSPDAINNCQGGNFPPGVPIDCDYSTSTSEQIDIPGVLAGESYILMITNYSKDPTDITLSPNNDHGTNTAVLGGPLAFQVSAAGPYTTGDTPVDLAITPEASNPNVSGVSFSGTGIIDTTNGTFDPVAAGVGTHRITVTGTSYGCVVSTEIDIVVNDKCDPVTSGNLDSDNDGVSDVCDLDDDNDGILDTVEYESCNAASFRLQGLFDDFGTGTTRTSTPYISNSYSFISTGNTVDGGYCIINTPNPGAADYASWGTYGDHTPGDIDGKMLIINAANLPGEFYRRSLTGIIPNTKAELSFWTRDICGNNCTVTPNVTYSILDSSNNVLATATTGNFPSSDWLNYKLTVDVGTNTELQFVLINNAPGGGGNDLAIDDISFTNIVCDADNDGIPNHLDLDSDNDGCNDAIESGGADANDDGLVDGDGVNSSGQVTTGGVILGTSYNGTTGREDVATRVIVDATSLVNQAVLNGNPVTFGITSAIATSTTVFTGTAPSTAPNYADASAMDVSGAIVYQWQEDGVDLSNTGVYSGVNTTTLTISNVTGLDGKVYKLVVTHPDNPCTRIVNEATLKVIPIIEAVTETTPGIDGLAGGTTAALTGNDTLNGVPVNIGTGPGDVVLTPDNVPAGLTLNGDGTVTIDANTPAGSYDVEYTICEVTNPMNCSQVTSTVVVTAPVIEAVVDTVAGVDGLAGGTTGALTGNDTLNGVPVNIGTGPGDVVLTPDNVPAGLTLNGDGTVTIDANTPAGSYDVEYTICEVTNPMNCSQVTSTVVVAAPVIEAVADTVAGVDGLAGGTTAALTGNDTLNGVPVNIGTGPGDVVLTPDNVPAGLTLNGDGTVTIDANTPAGSYDVEYTICEVTNPMNCSQVTSTVVVGAPVIEAVADTVAGVDGLAGGTTGALTGNDTLNGVPVNIGTGPGDVVLTPDNVPAGLTLNGDGTVTIDANTPAGSYDVEYTICEVTNPMNCSQVTSTVVVAAPVIEAVVDIVAGVDGLAGGTTPALTGNDTLNGVPVNIGTGPGDVVLTPDNVPAGLTLNADGTVTVAPGTPAGSYDVEYTICEVTNPMNCSQITSTVVVTAPVIEAVADTVAGVDGLAGGTTGALTGNDTLNGVPVNIGTGPGDVVLTPDNVPAGLTLNGDGTVTIDANTPAGSYDVEYTICEVTNPMNCSQVTSTVVVTAPVIEAVTETTPGIDGLAGGTTGALTGNDTLNGVPVNIGTGPGDVVLTPDNVPAGLTLNGDGTVTIDANTPAGSYDVEYTICEVTNPMNCSQVTSTVVVAAPLIEAVTETTPGIDGLAGGTTGALTGNDTLNGVPVNIGTGPGDVVLTPDNVPAGLTLNGDGTVTIDANTPAGSYDVEYTICEVTNPMNCSQVTSTVVVAAPVIEAVVDIVAGVDGLAGGTTPALTGNDTLNGVPVNIGTGPGDVVLTPDNVPAGLTLNADGTVTVAPGTPAGSYDVEYTICEVTNPMNCSSVISVVNVLGAPIVANNDTDASGLDTVNGFTGGIAGDVTENDTLNGVLVDDNDILITVLNEGGLTGVSIDGSGNLIVPSGTPSGSYTVTYQICEVLNPGNCDTATALVVVEPDTDGDGVVDSVDLDDDNDGILDVIEENGTPGLDTDNDGIPDTLDLDSDGDGILDIVESGQDAGSLDTDGDGVLDSTTDLDGDGIVDTADADDTNPSGGGKVNPVDTDNDGSPDFQDIDDDGDGVNTIDENPDPNTDGSVTDAQDTDNDGIPDYLDTDDDGDGVNTIDENPDPNTDSIITDAQDTDNDGVPDYLDTDDDGDGVNTIDENPDPNTDGSVTDAQDTDNDGIPDYLDTDETVTIYNEFTPNGDGDNDTFYIEFIERYPNNNLEIYNRWGNLVYSKKGYDNTFKGVSNGRLNIDENSKLPVGTYFYVLDLGESGKEPLKGWLYINR
ncbi:gliding motility-associated C-terminal domain-containing protein [Tenacibaculum maritimum]|uniref:T9SS type B sorting domain-containing protein n=1 Tax=Tenacibaculum maritimum TaxID=107401 RepID=UPI00388EA51A